MQRTSLVLSRRFTSWLYGVGALCGLVVYTLGSFQIWRAYFDGQGFDVPSSVFWSSELIFYVPFFTITAVMVWVLIVRWRLRRLFNRQLVTANYVPQAGLTPAEAGLLIDQDFRLGEVVATLYDLKLRGYIDIHKDSDITLEVKNANISGLRNFEADLLHSLFSRVAGGSYYGNTGGSLVAGMKTTVNSSLLTAAKKMHKQVAADLRQRGLLLNKKPNENTLRWILKICAALTAFVSIVLVAYLLKFPNKIILVSYPRFYMDISEPLLHSAVGLLMLCIITSAFFKRLSTKDGLLTQQYAAGLYLYVNTVFKDRLKPTAVRAGSVAKSDLALYYPYAIAFGIVDEQVVRFGNEASV